MKSERVRVLLVEHGEADAELFVKELERAGFEVLSDMVRTQEEFLGRLRSGVYDIVLADYRLPNWTGMDALALMQANGWDIPLILVTGSLGDIPAVECVKQGASDYVLKDNLVRLPMAVRRSLDDKRSREGRAQAEDRIRKLTLAVDQSPASVIITDTTGRIEYVNQRFVEMTGYSAAESRGQSPRLLRSGCTPLEVYQEMWKALGEGQVWHGELLNRTRNEALAWHSVTISPVRDSHGTVTHFLSTQEDITSRKRAERALREREERFRQIAENIKEVFFVMDAAYQQTLYISPAYEQIWGRTCRSLYENPRSFLEPVPADDRDRLLAMISQIQQGEQPPDIEFRVLRPDGEVRWVLTNAAPVRNEQGEVYRITGVAMDITERKRTEEALRESEERFRQLADNTKELFFITDPNTGYSIYLSPAYEEIWGRSRQSAYATPGAWLEGVHPEDRARLAAVERQGGTGERTWDVFRVVRPDGSIRWVRSHASPVLDAEGNLYRTVGVAEDFTERRRAEEALAESDALYRKVIEASFDGIAITQEGLVRESNRGFAAMFGYDPGEVTGRPLLDFVAEESVEAIRQRVSDGVEGTYELVGKRKDGAKILLEATAKTHNIGGRRGRLTALRDVTEKRHLEEQFRQAQKMEAVGRLAGGVAHDFNNLLTVIISCTELLLMDTEEGDPLRDNMEEIRKAAQGAAGLTRQLLAFSRQQVVEPKLVTIEEVVASAENMLQRLIGEDVELVAVLNDDPATVKIDPSQLEQVVMNLAVNARDAMPEGGKLTLETSSVELDEAYARTHWPAIPGRYALLAVSDTGIGMTEPTRARIFEPFFTTKEVGKGTGLGLATVYGIVKQGGGFIWVYSEPGQGATFKIYLPRVDEPPAASEPVMTATSLVGTETVLLIEDSPALRAAARQILERYGYSVLEAPNGKAALALAGSLAGPIHLLLTDVVMPGMSGRELAERFTATRPEVKVLYMSGYTDDAVVRHGVLRPGIAYLQKPFTPDTLGRKVREVLDGGAA